MSGDTPEVASAEARALRDRVARGELPRVNVLLAACWGDAVAFDALDADERGIAERSRQAPAPPPRTEAEARAAIDAFTRRLNGRDGLLVVEPVARWAEARPAPGPHPAVVRAYLRVLETGGLAADERVKNGGDLEGIALALAALPLDLSVALADCLRSIALGILPLPCGADPITPSVVSGARQLITGVAEHSARSAPGRTFAGEAASLLDAVRAAVTAGLLAPRAPGHALRRR